MLVCWLLTLVSWLCDTCVRHVPHGVLEGPDDGVENQLELLGRDREEGGEAVGVHGLKQVN